MTPDDRFRRYQDLQRYIGWTDADAANIQAIAHLLAPSLGPLVADFYAEIEKHPAARRVITGGPAQVERLKDSLVAWLQDLLSGPYDREYVERRWRVGLRHVEIGLDQVYTNVALSRLRVGMVSALAEAWTEDKARLVVTLQSLGKLLDLDLAKIEDAYQSEYVARQQRAERLAAIGQVGSGIAHELRNPLNNIKTSVYYLLTAKNPTAEKREEHLRRIERQVLLADRVITTLSNYAKMPVPDLRPTDVRQVTEEALSECVLPATISVVSSWPSDLPPALADADQLRIVLSNLIRNAREAMQEAGKLALAARISDGHVELDVADTGVGMSAEQLARLAEPLYTTKAKGLGLGLALARSILEKNRGTLHAVSELGAGTTFTVRLTAAPT